MRICTNWGEDRCEYVLNCTALYVYISFFSSITFFSSQFIIIIIIIFLSVIIIYTQHLCMYILGNLHVAEDACGVKQHMVYSYKVSLSLLLNMEVSTRISNTNRMDSPLVGN